jgi:hypothetical protein
MTNLTEPTTALLYLARDMQKKYGVPARVTCAVDTSGLVTMTVEAWRIDRWIEQHDAFGVELPDTPDRPSLTRP